MSTFWKITVAVCAVAIVVLAIFGFKHGSSLGDATVSNYPTWYYNGIAIGQDNDLIRNIDFGSCSPTGAVSLAAGHQENILCAASHVKVGDKISINSESNGGSSSNGGFPVISSTVSSPGVITISIVNNTLSTATPQVGPMDFVSFR